MGLVTSVFKPDPGDLAAGNGDAEFKTSGIEANAPLDVEAFVGTTVKNLNKAGYLARFWLSNPFSGPPIPNSVPVTITKAKISFEVSTTATVIDLEGAMRIGILNNRSRFWVFQENAFGLLSYALKAWLPLVTDRFDAMRADSLFNDAFLATDAAIAFTPATFAAGQTLEMGEGYPGMFATTTNFVSELNDYVSGAAFLLDWQSLGIVLDSDDTPINIENFGLWTSAAEPAHSGLTLTLEWEEGPAEITVESYGIEPAVTVKSASTDPTLTSESESVDAAVTSTSAAIDATVTAESESIDPAITAIERKGGTV